MPTRGEAADVEAASVAVEALGVLVDPGDAAPNLVGHHAEIAAGFLDLHEVERGVVRAGVVKHLGRVARRPRRAGAPAAAVEVAGDRRVALLAAIEPDLF